MIKLRDIIEGFKETRQSFLFYPSSGKKETSPSSQEYTQAFYDSFNTAATLLTAKEISHPFDKKKLPSVPAKPEMLSYLQTFWKILEMIVLFFPDKPLQPETQKAILKMTESAEKYLFHYLEKKYSLTQEQLSLFKETCRGKNADDFLLQTRMEAAGIDERTIQWAIAILQLLKKINLQTERSFHSEEMKSDALSG